MYMEKAHLKITGSQPHSFGLPSSQGDAVPALARLSTQLILITTVRGRSTGNTTDFPILFSVLHAKMVLDRVCWQHYSLQLVGAAFPAVPALLIHGQRAARRHPATLRTGRGLQRQPYAQHVTAVYFTILLDVNSWDEMWRPYLPTF